MKIGLAITRLSLAAALLLVGSCVASNPGEGTHPGEPGSPSPGASTELEVAMHGQTQWGATGLRLDFTDVTSDSRCPQGTNCVWAGNAVVELSASRGGRIESFALRVGPAGSTGDIVSDSEDRLGIRFQAVRLAPEPGAGRTIDKLSYRLIVRATVL